MAGVLFPGSCVADSAHASPGCAAHLVELGWQVVKEEGVNFGHVSRFECVVLQALWLARGLFSNVY